MPTITLSVKYGKNEDLLLTPSELRDLYFYGINIKSKDGTEISEETWKSYILAAQQYIERLLNIKFKPQIIEEDQSYQRDEFMAFGFIRCTYPVVKSLGLDGWLATVKQITYPNTWLASRKTSDGITYFRNMYILPNQGSATTTSTGSLIYNGIIPYLGILGYNSIPDYWTIRYGTGYTKIPIDLLNVVGMMACIIPFGVLGDLTRNMPGLTSQSIGIDGLSQSTSGDNNSFKYRIDQYTKQVQEYLKNLKGYYKGLSIATM